MAEYVAELRRLATHCQFDNYLDEALRDRLVCGICQNRILSEAELSLKKAIELSQAFKAAQKNTKEIQVPESEVVQQVSNSNMPRQSPKKPCHHCGKGFHNPSECHYKDFVCKKCKKRGHLARVCHSKKTIRAETNMVEVESDNEQSDLKAENAIHCVTQTINKPLIVQLEINGKQSPFEVDTGAAVSLISLETKQKFLKDVQIQETTVSLHTYTSQSIQVVGTMQVQVRYGDHVGEHKLFVIKGVGSTLVGRDWLQDIRLDWKSLGVAKIQSGSLNLTELLRGHKELFEEGQGTIKGFKARLARECQAKVLSSSPSTFCIKGAH